MVTLRLCDRALARSVGIVLALMPATAAAQTSTSFTGFITASIGGAAGGDVTDRSLMPSVATAVVGESDLGAEVDVSQVRDFDNARFSDSRITSVMFNVFGILTDAPTRVRPYVLGGVGVLSSRVCSIDCQSATSQASFGFDAGGGVFVIWNETIGARGDVRYVQSLQRPQDSPFDGYLNFWRTSIGITLSWPIR